MDDLVALLQGIYFLVFGIWPLLSISSFLRVTGPKTDLWLVRTAGLLLTVIGAALIIAQLYAQVNAAITVLAIGSALSLAMIEFIYVARRIIPQIYLVDAIIELLFIGWWILSGLLY